MRLARTDQHPLQNSPDGNIGFGWVKPEHELELPVLSPRVADCNQRTRDMGSGGVTLYSPVQDVHLKCQNRKLEKQPEATTRQEAQHVCEVHCMPRIPWESSHLRETLAGSIGTSQYRTRAKCCSGVRVRADFTLLKRAPLSNLQKCPVLKFSGNPTRTCYPHFQTVDSRSGSEARSTALPPGAIEDAAMRPMRGSLRRSFPGRITVQLAWGASPRTRSAAAMAVCRRSLGLAGWTSGTPRRWHHRIAFVNKSTFRPGR